MRIVHFYWVAGIGEDPGSERHARMVIEAGKKLRKIYGEDYELGSAIQPENAKAKILPTGLPHGVYVYTDHLVPGWKVARSVIWDMGEARN